jgi:hypothetical protein
MRLGLGIAVGLTTAFAVVSPAIAKDCVEPYGELVQVSEFESVVRVKPECEDMQRAAISKRTGVKPTEISLGLSMNFESVVESSGSQRARLPDAGELAPRRGLAARRPVSCSDPAVCGRSRLAMVEKSFDCDDGRGYTVSLSSGLSEVRIVEKCRHLMNPKGEAITFVLPHVLAPDWELDNSPAPRKVNRPFRAKPDCTDPASCGGASAKRSTEGTGAPVPVEQPTSGASTVLGSSAHVTIEWRTADLDLGSRARLLATRNRRYPSARA